MFLLKQLAHILESDYIALSRIDDSGLIDVLTHNYPELWSQHYQQQNYFAHDYARDISKSSFTPIVWSHKEYSKGSETQRRLYSEAKTYQLNSGVSMRFSIAGNKQTSICFASHEQEKNFKSFVKKKKNNLIPQFFMINTYLECLSNNKNDEATLHQIFSLIKEHHRLHQKHQHDLIKSLRLLKAFNGEIDMVVPASIRQYTLPLCRLAQRQFEKYIDTLY